MDLAVSEMTVDDIAPATRMDEVTPVACVDEVLARATDEMVHLRHRLTAGLEVAPDDIARRAGMDGVVPVSTEQFVVPDVVRHHGGCVASRAHARRVLVQAVARVAGVGAAEGILSRPAVEGPALVLAVHQEHPGDFGPSGMAGLAGRGSWGPQAKGE